VTKINSLIKHLYKFGVATPDDIFKTAI